MILEKLQFFRSRRQKNYDDKIIVRRKLALVKLFLRVIQMLVCFNSFGDDFTILAKTVKRKNKIRKIIDSKGID